MKKAWKEYQKDIADDNYFYARSCIRQNFFPGSEAAFLNILRNDLGRDVYEDPKHTSCTGIGYHSDIVPLETIMTVVARQFSLMTEAGYENFTSSCITSFGIYCEALELWHDFPEQEEKAREYLYKATGREFRKPKNLAHTSDVIFHHREQIASQAKYRADRRRDGPAAARSRAHRLSLREDFSESRRRRIGVPLRAGRHDRVVGRRSGRLSGAAALLRLRLPQLPGHGQSGILRSQLEKEIRIDGSV